MGRSRFYVVGLVACAGCNNLLGIGTVVSGATDAAGVSDAASAVDAASGSPDASIQPPGTVAVNLRVDDRANKVYAAVAADGASDLRWKGSFSYATTTRTMTFDGSWPGEGAPLYDDGPWVSGGHEPRGATAGDHIWGLTAFVAPPAASTMFAYGVVDDLYARTYGNGWIWIGSNGGFTVTPTTTGEIDAPGEVLPAFGDRDLRVTLDTKALDTMYGPWTTASSVKVRSSAWGWTDQAMTVDGNGLATFTLSGAIGPGKVLPHTGLAPAGSSPELVFVLDGKLYTHMTTCIDSLSAGAGAATELPGQSTFVSQPLGEHACGTGSGNLYFVVP